jgi:hypothetical protein
MPRAGAACLIIADRNLIATLSVAHGSTMSAVAYWPQCHDLAATSRKSGRYLGQRAAGACAADRGCKACLHQVEPDIAGVTTDAILVSSMRS